MTRPDAADIINVVTDQDSTGSAQEHRDQAGDRRGRCAVLTVSDTRSKHDDGGGPIIVHALESAGHHVVAYQIVKDDVVLISSRLRQWIADEDIDLICTTGGTGISGRDTTIEAVERLLDKPIVGFGELFRMLSYDQVGSAAMLSRAVAGLADDTFIFAMPGSTKAVQLAMQKLIVPELSHLLWERSR